ncbi:MAG: hypothetical protein KAU49_06600 [Candidatus Krumholzibacteria bacterium]|nr:hypothetical protein [Candidatus Krumholzibacteria bacterium]
MNDARDIIDQTVLVKLISCEGIEFTGIEGDGPFFCKVTAVDEAGIWVENKKFTTVELRDSRGKSVPEKKRKPQKHTVHILLLWRNIQTIIMFEEKDLEKLEVDKDAIEQTGRIGFIK